MSGPVKHRTVSPLIKFIQDIGRGRKIVLPHRFTDEQAARTQPPPNLPDGPYHKTSLIYYYTRDVRREVQPPLLLSGSKQISIEDKGTPKKEYYSPGKPYNWDA